MSKKTVTACVQARKSIRAFLPDSISLETVKTLISKASRAASGGNTQPWKVYVVSGDELKAVSEKALKKLDNGEIEAAEYSVYPAPEAQPEFMKRRRELGFEMFRLLGVDRKDKVRRFQEIRKNYEFFGAPVGMLVTVDRSCDRNGWGHVGMFLDHLSLLAVEIGLGTCFEEAWNMFPETIYNHFGIDKEKEILWCGVALGKPDWSEKVNELQSKRVPLEDFAVFKGFDTKSNL